MGSFDVSCSLTGTPIYPGDACYFVLLRKKFVPHDTVQPEADYDVELVLDTTYYDYGYPEVTGKEQDKYISNCTGYNSGRYFFYICKEAWQWAVENFKVTKFDPSELDKLLIETHKALGKEYTPPRVIPPWAKEMQAVFYAFGHCCRNVLSGYWATGQWCGEYPLEHIEQLAKLTAKIVKRQRKEQKEL